VLRPRSYHIMLIGLAAPLRAGDTLDATLIFQHAGRITVPVAVLQPWSMDFDDR
jgi:periplasmic copper chaperone A